MPKSENIDEITNQLKYLAGWQWNLKGASDLEKLSVLEGKLQSLIIDCEWARIRIANAERLPTKS